MNKSLLIVGLIVTGLLVLVVTAQGRKKDVIEMVTDMATGTTRGIRNNNPGNIEYNKANNWNGQTGHDGRFIQFDTMENGVRALTILIVNYYQRYGAVTVEQILNRYAPGHENPTNSYIDFVADKVGVAPRQMLNLDEHLLSLIGAIIRFENGQDIAPGQLVAGFGAGMAAKGMQTQYAAYGQQMTELLA